MIVSNRVFLMRSKYNYVLRYLVTSECLKKSDSSLTASKKTYENEDNKRLEKKETRFYSRRRQNSENDTSRLPQGSKDVYIEGKESKAEGKDLTNGLPEPTPGRKVQIEKISEKESVKLTRPQKRIKIRQGFDESLIQKLKAVTDIFGDTTGVMEKELMEAYRLLKSGKGKLPDADSKKHDKAFEKSYKQIDESSFDTLKSMRLLQKGTVDVGPMREIFEKFQKNAQEDEGKHNVDNCLHLWNSLETRTLENMSFSLPNNYFEEMLLWTKERKLWHFPIDNDQDNEAEKYVDFTEHVFLDKHLESWCPSEGPIRHFMELIVVALSKNCFLTATEKKEFIMWYRDYFEKKKKLLVDLGVYEETKIMT